MFRHLVLSAVAVFALNACSAYSEKEPNNPPVRNSKPGPGALVVMGDSLAAGYGTTDVMLKPASCIGMKMQMRPVSDYSVSGSTSSQILAKADQVVSVRPKVIFVSAGGNDAISEVNRPGSYPASKTLSEMSSLFDRLLNSGALVVYLGLNPPYAGGERMPQVTQLARSKGVLVVDGMNGLWGNSQFMSDQIHPNDNGYGILCNRVVDTMGAYYP